MAGRTALKGQYRVLWACIRGEPICQDIREGVSKEVTLQLRSEGWRTKRQRETGGEGCSRQCDPQAMVGVCKNEKEAPGWNHREGHERGRRRKERPRGQDFVGQ